MQYTINELRSEVFQRVYETYEVFKNYFGESSVDLQNLPDDDYIANLLKEREVPIREDGSCYEADSRHFDMVKRELSVIKPFILVYWPQVTVTNEQDRHINIKDLYAKIELDSKGRIPTENRGFLLNRATYNIEQWTSNYMHSHICDIPKGNLKAFQQPCLGSGPILDTITSLKSDLAEYFDEIRWMLFCEELSRYVTVESIAGVPYHSLEDVSMGSEPPDYRGFNSNESHMSMGLVKLSRVFDTKYEDVLKDFILWYLKHGHLSFTYQKGMFQIGMSHFDYLIDISNSFIDYFNSHYDNKDLARKCFNVKLLNEVTTAGNRFYSITNNRPVPDVSAYVGQKVCDFKGHEVKLSITTIRDFTPQKTTVLDHGLAMYILNIILKIINYHYTNEYTRQHCPGSTAALPAPIGQRVYYI